MDDPAEAADYDAMDHAAVNTRFIADFLGTLSTRTVPRRRAGGVNPLQRSSPPITFPLSKPSSGLARPSFLLDLGTGTALIPLELLPQAINTTIIAVDAARSMLDLAAAHCRNAVEGSRLALVQADAKHLPFADACFDRVISNSIIHHIPDPAAVIAEIVRVTAPGGQIFVRDLMRPDSARELTELVTTYAGDATPAQRKLFADSLHAALTVDEVRALVAVHAFPPETVTATSDRHWTWSAVIPD